VIAAFKENRYYKYYAPLVEFLFYAGCRPSEALALQWKHIGSSTVTFERALVYAGRDGLVLKKGLKTQDKRKFSINSQLAALLEKIRPLKCNPEALVFPSPKDKLIDWHNFTNRA
jgi:integrase